MFLAQRQRAAQSSSGLIRVISSLGSGAILAMASAAPALAGQPSPLLIDPLDPRAEGEGAGLVGDPLLALALVIVLGLLAAAAAVLYVRLIAGRGRST